MRIPRKRMRQRGVSDAEVLEVLRFPDVELPARAERRNRFKVIGFRRIRVTFWYKSPDVYYVRTVTATEVVAMTQTLKEIEWSGVLGDPMYFRFSDSPVATTQEFAAGEVNIDVDSDGKVVGAELLSGDAEDFAVFLKIAEARGLDLSGVHLAPQLVARA